MSVLRDKRAISATNAVSAHGAPIGLRLPQTAGEPPLSGVDHVDRDVRWARRPRGP
jgi:hypothetical protein